MPVPSDWPQQLRAFVDKLKADPNRPLGDEPFEHFVLAEAAPVLSWEAFLNWLNELEGSWCFRGQRQASWGLHPSQDRAVLVEYEFKNSSGYYHLDRKIEERELLFQFKQRAHQFINNLPQSNDLSSWLALMQHHGVPTRFLDWTRSPYVAMYFALEEEAQRPERHSTLWAIDLGWLEGKAREVLLPEAAPSDPSGPKAGADYLNSLLDRVEKPVIVSIDPQHADERMTAQQGFFLCKLIPQASFSQILMSMMIHPSTPKRPVVRRLEVDATNRIGFLKRLRAMNIHRASLFPDLDGFCRSLRLNSEIKAKEAAQEAGPSISDLRKML
jgi:hypothetical protein